MNNPQPPSPAPTKRRRWLRLLTILAGGLVLLLVIAWFVVTSGGFFKSVILPRVGAAAHATITVEDAAISPFSQVVLRNLKVQTTGSEPLVTAKEVRVRYHLMDILGGNLNVDEVALVSPVVNLIENADGTSNLDPLLKSATAKETKPAPATQPAKPVQLRLKKFTLTDASIHKIKTHPGGQRDVTDLANVNITIADLQNGQSGKLTLSADVKIENHPPSPAASGSLQAKIAGDFAFTLAADLKPVSVKGNTHLAVSQAAGALRDLAALGADLDCEVTPAEIKQLALRFQKSGAPLGGLRVSGPFAMEKTEGRLAVELLALDRQILNLAGAASGIDFGGTTINSTNEVELTKSGTVIIARGSLTAAKLQITRAAQSTPVLDVRADYGVTVDRTAQSALLRALNVTATQNQNPLLRAELSSPMTLAWGTTAGAVGDSALAVNLTGLNLADWRAFAADLAPEGVLNAQLKLVSQQGGKQLAFDLDSSISGLSARFGSNAISSADVRLQAQGRGTDFKQFNLASYRLDLAQRGESALTVSGAGTFDRVTADADLQVAVQSALIRLLAIFPQPGTQLGGGTLDFKGRLSSKAQTQTITGELALADLAMSGAPEKPLAAKLQLDASVSKNVADLRQCQLALSPTARARNELKLTGKVDFSKPAAITGNLKLLADTLDMTGYYDLFGGKSATTPAAATPAAPPREAEPAAVSLPFRNFVVEAAIGLLYLHEVDVANFQTTLKLDGGHVLLQPFALTLNGAPVNANANLNLGVPGYQYDIGFTATGVPIAPLANSFSPAYRGQAMGDFSANAKVKGAGITGISLQTNLTGDVSLALTNANIQLVGPKARTLITPIALVLGLDELQRSPLSGLNANLKMGSGKIALTQCDVASDAFRADTTGEIPIAAVLNNSPLNDWPLNFALSRNLAAKSRLLSSDTPTNATFVRLPTFVKLGGTLGKPEAKTDKLVIAGLLARSIGGVPGVVGGDAGKILQGLGGLLGGQATQPPATVPQTNVPANATPPANQNQPVNLFDLFKKK